MISRRKFLEHAAVAGATAAAPKLFGQTLLTPRERPISPPPPKIPLPAGYRLAFYESFTNPNFASASVARKGQLLGIYPALPRWYAGRPDGRNFGCGFFNYPGGDGWPFGTAQTPGNGPVAGVDTYGAIRAWQCIDYQGSRSGYSSGLIATVDPTGAGAAWKQPYLETKIWLPAPVIGRNTLALNITCGSAGTAPPYDPKDSGYPQGKSGLWPAVVLQSNNFVHQDSSTISAEIDVFEAYSVGYATKYNLSKKIWKSGSIIGGTPMETISYPYANGVGAWHTYGMSSANRPRALLP